MHDQILAPQAGEAIKRPQDINRKTRIQRYHHPQTRSRKGSIPPRSRTRNAQHGLAVTDTNKAFGSNPYLKQPRLLILSVGGAVHGVTPNLVP